jgi:hypothetical protein
MDVAQWWSISISKWYYQPHLSHFDFCMAIY